MPSSNPLRIGFAGSIRSPILGRYLNGMRSYARVHGGIEIVDCRQAQEFPRFQPTDLPLWRDRVDGVVLAAGYDGPADELLAWIGRGGVPAISVRADIFDPRLAVVCIDPESIARLAMEHLLSLGVASFLHVGSARCNGTRRRAEALARVLAARGRATAAHECDGLIFGGLDDEATLARDDQLTGLLSTLPRPIGVLCLNDLIGRAVAIRCSSLGLAVGEDALVIGVEDSPLAVEAKPSLTSIQIPCETVGARGVAVLCEMIGAGRLTRPEMPVELVAATKLVPRESTAGQAADASPLANWLAYFDQHGHKGLATTRIAEDLGLTQRAFERQFQRLVGHSPAEETRRRRLERAKTLLADRTVPIAGIAAAIGFSEAAAFSRFFRKHAGCTPREYRRAAAEQSPG